MLFGGVDEAGYGPLLGPLSIAAVAAEAADETALKQGFRRARTGAKDSKQVHTPGDIAGIEAVALPAIAWLSGAVPADAAACFALLGEDPVVHDGAPWMAAARELRLPVAARKLKEWRVPGVEPRVLRGRLIQPREYNAALREGLNKAELELEAVGALLREVRRPDVPGAIIVDRLGGRRYYHGFLQELWTDAVVLIDAEMPYVSTYRAIGASAEQSIGFCVDGESRSPLTAVASCVAKYARELHMLLLNRWWSGRHPALRPTAGYIRDARRWLADVGEAALDAFRDALVRNGPAEPDADEPQEAIAEA